MLKPEGGLGLLDSSLQCRESFYSWIIRHTLVLSESPGFAVLLSKCEEKFAMCQKYLCDIGAFPNTEAS